MPVIELALAHTLPPHTTSSPTLQTHLSHARHVLSTSSGHSFAILKQTANQTHFFILGAWASRSAHVDGFLPSEANQSLLALIKDEIAVEWMFHVDERLARASAEGSGGGGGFRVPGVGEGGALWVVRAKVKEGKRADVEGKVLSKWTGAAGAVGGWRIEDEETGPEWVMFLAYDPSPEGYLVCFKDGEEQARHVDWVEVNEAVRLVES